MSPILQNALRAGSLSILGCIREIIVDGERLYDFGGKFVLCPWAALSDADQQELVGQIIEWHDDLMFETDEVDGDEEDLSEVLRKIMI